MQMHYPSEIWIPVRSQETEYDYIIWSIPHLRAQLKFSLFVLLLLQVKLVDCVRSDALLVESRDMSEYTNVRRLPAVGARHIV